LTNSWRRGVVVHHFVILPVCAENSFIISLASATQIDLQVPVLAALGCIVRLRRMQKVLTIRTDVQSVRHAAQIGGGACRIRRVPYARGHSVQPLPNAFGLLFVIRMCGG